MEENIHNTTLFLDSDVIIGLIHKKIDINSFKRITSKYEYLATTSANLFELYNGYYNLKYSKNMRTIQYLEKEYNALNKIIRNLEIHDLNSKSAKTAANIYNRLINTGNSIDTFDCIIAAIIIESNNKQILTLNKKHYSRISELNIVELDQ